MFYHHGIILAGEADVVVLGGEGQGDKEKGRQGEKERDFSQESFHYVKELGLMQ